MRTTLLPRVGLPARWSRDLALVGGVVAALAPCVEGWDAELSLAASLAGAVAGGVLGRVAPGVLDRQRGRVPLAALACLAPLVGAGWGGFAGMAGGIAARVEPPIVVGAWGAVVGALLVGMLWLPYTVQSLRGAPTWPVVLAALLSAPFLGAIAAVTLGLLIVFPVLAAPVGVVGVAGMVVLRRAERRAVWKRLEPGRRAPCSEPSASTAVRP